MSRICSELHQVLNQLPHFKYPFDFRRLPQNGIYYLFEKGETAHSVNRIVRVGSHRGQGNLPSRLIEHYVKENKDRSIFRKNIGRAILNQSNDPFMEKWEIDLTKKEAKDNYDLKVDLEYQKMIEAQVTGIIRSNFSFVFIPVSSLGDRNYFESRSIATISLCDQCKPSKNWLGLSSPIQKIRESGLWNVQHLYKEPLVEKDLDRLRALSIG